MAGAGGFREASTRKSASAITFCSPSDSTSLGRCSPPATAFLVLVQIERLGVDVAENRKAKNLAEGRRVDVRGREHRFAWLDAGARVVVVPGRHVLRKDGDCIEEQRNGAGTEDSGTSKRSWQLRINSIPIWQKDAVSHGGVNSGALRVIHPSPRQLSGGGCSGATS